jgi:uncharacterized membrane-anchored protein YjiN (DUF445 family)
MIREFKTNEHTYKFVCKSYGTRTGFNHYAEMYKDSYPYSITENTCHYINRTWERREFDTVINGCVDELKRERETKLKEIFKAENNIKRMTAKTKSQLEEIIKNDNEIKELNELSSVIRGY